VKKKRIIPLVLFKDGFVIQSKTFSEYRNLGNPYASIARLSEWGADEVSFIDIGTRGENNQRRTDLGREVLPSYLEVLERVSETARMPLSSGGKVKNLEDISDRLKRGAEKVVINTAAFEDPLFLAAAIKTFGSQCITISMDVRYKNEKYEIYIKNGAKPIHGTLDYWLNYINEMQAGELFLTSIDQDGTKKGFDINLANYAAERIRIPLIICGGAGKWEHFQEALEIDGVDAVAAANIFQHTDQSVYLAHKFLYHKGLNVRKPKLLK
jgi:cyclase